jgi:hypothetical protein
MEKIIKSMKLKKMKKGELAGYIYENQADIVGWYNKNAFSQKARKTIEHLYDKMSDEKFPIALKKIIKRGKKEKDIILDPGFSIIINGYIEWASKQENKDLYVDSISDYVEVVKDLLKKRTKKISKASGVSEDVIFELITIAPDDQYIKGIRQMTFALRKMLRKLYLLANSMDISAELPDVKTIRKMFKTIFGKDMLDYVAIVVLLEKKEFTKNYNEKQMAVWSMLTDFALNEIESLKKKEIKKRLEYYAERRMIDAKKGNDSARRYNLKGLSKEEYPKIGEVVESIRGKASNYL